MGNARNCLIRDGPGNREIAVAIRAQEEADYAS